MSGELKTKMWRRVVKYIIDRDRGICHLCGHSGADTADHVLPRSLHPEIGAFDTRNLKAAHHRPCVQCSRLADKPIRCNVIRQDREIPWFRRKLKEYTGRDGSSIPVDTSDELPGDEDFE